MDLGKLISKLRHRLERDEVCGQGDCVKLDELLHKLCARKKKLEKQLKREENKSRRKRLKLQRRLLRAELKRALRRRRELRRDAQT